MKKSWTPDKHKLSYFEAQGLAFPISAVDKENIKYYKNGLSSAPFRFFRSKSLPPQQHCKKWGIFLFKLWVLVGLRGLCFQDTPISVFHGKSWKRESGCPRAPSSKILKFFKSHKAPLPVLRLSTLKSTTLTCQHSGLNWKLTSFSAFTG